ncbi:MAG TPA: hypothetical protein VK674_02275 [Candidatus Limnocylindria bacterium]|nr:hypothetical protein [Candidatus Limnocylindria bacterium]
MSNRGQVQGAPSTTLNFQARILSGSGALVPDGNYHVEFKLYNVATDGNTPKDQGACTYSGGTPDSNCEWTETRTTGNLVTVKNGYLSVYLGSVNSFSGTINWNEEHWLTMNIGGSGGSPSWDGEMSPRIKLTAVPYAFQAGQLVKTSGANRGVLAFDTVANNPDIELPDEDGTVCLQNSSSCGFIAGSGSAFIQGGNDFNATAVLGTTDADALNLITNGSTRLAISSTGATTITGGTSGNPVALTVNNSTSTGAILVLQDNGSPVFTVANGGNITATGTLTVQAAGTSDFAGTVDIAGNLFVGDNASPGGVPAALVVNEIYTGSDSCGLNCYAASFIPTASGVTSGGVAGLVASVSTSGTFTLPLAVGVAIRDPEEGTATITQNTGLYVQHQGAGVTDYGIYVEGADTYALFVDAGATRLDGTLEVRTLGNTDSASYLCYNTDEQLAACNTTGDGAAFVQGGNNFGASTTGELGMTSNNALDIITNNLTRLTVQADGDVAFNTNTLFVDAVNNRVGVGQASPDARLEVTGNLSQAAWGLNGIQFQASGATYTDTGSAGTRTNTVINSFGQSTIASTNAVTSTNAATVYVQNAPAAGTNHTITNAYALWVDDGNARFDGNVAINSVASAARLSVTGRDSTSGTGTVSSSGGTVTGTNTLFTREVSVGTVITASGQSRTVIAIASNTSLTVDNNFSPNLSAASFTYRQPIATFTQPGNPDGERTNLLYVDRADGQAAFGLNFNFAWVGGGNGVDPTTWTSLAPGAATVAFGYAGGGSAFIAGAGNTLFQVNPGTGGSRGVNIGGGTIVTRNQALAIGFNETPADSDATIHVRQTIPGASYVGYRLRAAASQSADILQVTTSVGGALLNMNASGNLGIGDATPTHLLTVGNGELFGVNSSGNVIVNAPGTANTDTVVCRNASNHLSNCSSTFATTANAFLLDGNTVSSTAVLGTNSSHSLALETAGVTRLTIDTSGNANLTGSLTLSGDVIGGTTQGDVLTLRGSNQAWSSTTPNEVEVLNSRLTFNGQTSVANGTFPALISFNDTVSVAGASVWALLGYDYAPTFQQDTSFSFGSAPAFSASPTFQPTVGGINDAALFTISGYAASVSHRLNHSGAAGTTAVMTGYYDNPFFGRAGGTGTHTVTDYAGYMTWLPRLFDDHVQAGYTLTTARSFWARNPEASGGGTVVNNIGLDVSTLSTGTTSNIGVRIAEPSGTGAVALSLTGTGGTSASGILFGNDTSLYRSAANVLSTNATSILGTGALTVSSATTSTVTLDSGTTGTVNVGTGANAKIISIGTGAVANTINIGGTGANAIGMGNTQTAGSVAIGAAMTTGTISIGGTGLQTGTITFGGGTGAQIVNLGTGNTGVKTVNLGTGTAANVISIGTGQTAGSISLGTAMTGGTISIGGTGLQTGTINLGVGTGAQAINLGTGGTGAKTVTLGSTASTGATTIQSGTGGISLLGTVVARTTTDAANVFQLQNSVGATLFSLDSTNTGSGLNVALNSGAESGCPTSPTSWAAHSSTLSCESSIVASGTYSARAATTGAAQGLRNNVGTAMSASTTYNISFSVRTSVALANSNLVVVLSPTGTASNNSTCVAGTNPTLSTSSFTKFTCAMTTNSTATNSSAYLAIYQSDGTTRNMYVDNLSIVSRNSSGTQNTGVLRIGGTTSQGLTLLTLDTYAGTPFTGANASLAGSMYYDTTSGKIQCYDGTAWGACGAAPDNIITLTPEYAGAVLNGGGFPGVGTLTSDFCSNDAALSVGSLCASGEVRNFYKWTSPQPTMQTYSIYVNYKLPTTFEGFIDANTIKLTWLTDAASGTNGKVTYQVYRKASSGGVTSCDGVTESTVTTPTANAWNTTLFNGNETACGFAPGDYIIFKINVKAMNEANVYVENLDFTYTNQ